MSQKLSVPATTFLSHVDSAMAWLEWIATSIRSDEFVRGRIDWNGLSQPQRTIVQKKLDLPVPEQRLMLNALYITVVAAFEEYLRQLVARLADEFTKRQLKWDGASEKLMRLNVRESARLLRKMDSPPDYLVVDFWDVCRQLGTCHPSSTAVALNSVALTDVESLIKLENFMERAEAFGTTLTFDVLAKNDDICAALGLKRNATRENAKEVRETAQEIARLRNRIAHTGVNASDVTEDVLQRHIGFLKGLVSSFDADVQTAIVKIQKQKKAS